MTGSDVGDDELLAHFVVESNKFKGDGIDHRAFLPSKTENNKSVFRVTGLSQAEVSDIGVAFVGYPRGKTVYGWAELTAQVVRCIGLTCRPDEPPQRHALIEGWPEAPEDRRTRAMQLASKSIRRDATPVRTR